VPGAGLCVTFYRLFSELPPGARLRVRKDILLGSLFRCLNINYREWRYHQRRLLRLPGDLARVFPEFTEAVRCPKRGWGIAETLVLNEDGSLPRHAGEEMGALQDMGLRREIYGAVAALLERLAEHSVCFFDPQNVLVQWTGGGRFRLRIVDFEPTCRVFVPGMAYVRPYVRRTVRRRAARYLARLRGLLGDAPQR
jgi:hypothetical protein